MAGPGVAAAPAAVGLGAKVAGWLGTAGKILGGIGAVGGLFGKQGGDRKGLYFTDLVRDAQRAGIHPLAAIGHQGYSPTLTSGSARGDALERAGQYMTRESEAYQNAKLSEEIGRAQVRSLRAASSRDEAQAILALSEASRIAQASNGQPDNPGLTVEGLTIDGVPFDQGKHSQWKGGGVVMEPPKPVWRQVRLMNGMLFNVPNQEIFEVPEGLGYLMYLLEAGKTADAEQFAKSQGGSIWDIFQFNFP